MDGKFKCIEWKKLPSELQSPDDTWEPEEMTEAQWDILCKVLIGSPYKNIHRILLTNKGVEYFESEIEVDSYGDSE